MIVIIGLLIDSNNKISGLEKKRANEIEQRSGIRKNNFLLLSIVMVSLFIVIILFIRTNNQSLDSSTVGLKPTETKRGVVNTTLPSVFL